MITIIDYGMGNLRSVQKGFIKVGYPAEISGDPAKILAADGVVLPGVGAFGRCMENLDKYGLVETIKEFVNKDRPFLGICLGLQLLFDESEEFGPVRGLGIIPGKALRFPESNGLKIPQMGWNVIEKVGDAPILRGVESGSFVYFVHSYYPSPDSPEDVYAVANYESDFCVALGRDNLFATQFHPEKSGHVGLDLLARFVAWDGKCQ